MSNPVFSPMPNPNNAGLVDIACMRREISGQLNEVGVEHRIADQPQSFGHLDTALAKHTESIVLKYHYLGNDGGSRRGSSDDTIAGLISLHQSPVQRCAPNQRRKPKLIASSEREERSFADNLGECGRPRIRAFAYMHDVNGRWFEHRKELMIVTRSLGASLAVGTTAIRALIPPAKSTISRNISESSDFFSLPPMGIRSRGIGLYHSVSCRAA